MGPAAYTELFFLDEATAYAAGHRPCAECRYRDYKEFSGYWREVHGNPEPGRPLSKSIDRRLHAHRIARNRQKVTFEAAAEDLPDGTIFALGDQAVLVWNSWQLDWSFTGYRKRAFSGRGSVTVLTPRPIVELFSEGLRPRVHGSGAN
ncbi:MAG TPA: hypothetical protein VK035_03710 [Kiloniellales bacterium]|nr:hypothetical protein [Kiloniellales bacterium]